MCALYLGLISGTSMDAVDAALVDFDATPPRVVACRADPLPDEIKQALLRLAAEHSPHPIQCLGELDHLLGERFAQCALALLEQAGVDADQVTAIGSHGQTLYHRPDGDTPFSLQIGDPNRIAERTGITTVADFRRRDMAAGGQGAPLVPAFHVGVFHSPAEARVVLNIGGMANLTLLPRDGDVTGFDTGPGNALLDAWAERHLHHPLDQGGRWAASGKIHAGLLERLLDDPYFDLAPPKSTGRELFNMRWLEARLEGIEASAADVQATLSELTALTISDAINTLLPEAARVLVHGGGAHNTHLMTRIQARLEAELHPTDRLGIGPDWVEAVAFAWLAKQTLEKRAGNLPSVTGARHPVVLGGIYFG